MRPLAAVFLAVAFFAPEARADVLGDWTDIALAACAKQPAFVQSRTLAMVHVAMFETLNALDARYTPYKVKAVPSLGTSAEAAAAVAAHDVLTSLYPSQAATLDASLDISLVRITDPGVRASSVALGQRVAAGILALRASDGADAPNTWRPMTAPGVYIPTSLPTGSGWGKVTPWVLEKADQFRPGPPPALASAEWARDYNEVKSLGAKDSPSRSAAQTETALFWSTSTPSLYTAAVRAVMDVGGRSLVQNARLLALASMAHADALIAAFDTKYAYNFWRPLTAIRDGDIDQNDATAPDRSWEPLAEGSMNPDYPSSHCTGAGAVTAVLEREFGASARGFRLTSPAVPKVSHAFGRLSDLTNEVSNAGVWAGIHYRNSTVVGVAMGKKIGDYIWDKVLRPLK